MPFSSVPGVAASVFVGDAYIFRCKLAKGSMPSKVYLNTCTDGRDLDMGPPLPMILSRATRFRDDSFAQGIDNRLKFRICTGF